MTKEELDNLVVDKKLSQLNNDDKYFLINYFSNGYATTANIGRGPKLLKLNFIKKAKNAFDDIYELTTFGKIAKRKLSAEVIIPFIPFDKGIK